MGVTSIEWAHYTFNPWRGCTKVSDGCKFCYADRQSARNPKVLGIWGPNGTRAIGAEAYWKLPFKWNEEAKAAGERRRVFCASLADFFEGPETMPAEAVEDVRISRLRTFDIIDATPWLDWLLVTKRPENVREMWPGGYETPFASMPPVLTRRQNVWLLTSVEDQETADKRIPELLKCRDLSPVLGLSMEPMLGLVDLTKVAARNRDGVTYMINAVSGLHGVSRGPFLDWVIVGGESGANARPMHPNWVRHLCKQCLVCGVPFFFKQWGEFEPVTPLYHGRDDSAENGRGNLVQVDTAGRIWGDGDGQPNDLQTWLMERVGKKAAGRVLDGQTWDELALVVWS
ncbi:phage Gp37/Gp68 family protein [Humisphaera borealis]|uniref:DUF5131 family protein n=1 Tax=Humisphaera borealis TaxID=2807512 RepID=A0A7M2WZI8_9BACT|nr:phage Gp37/Gp68 family protein [Humisphaera borealis]QOV90918.1 DUF5131 family protein [Humisphaera borealis]